jgi:hypothetical protein
LCDASANLLQKIHVEPMHAPAAKMPACGEKTVGHPLQEKITSDPW